MRRVNGSWFHRADHGYQEARMIINKGPRDNAKEGRAEEEEEKGVERPSTRSGPVEG